VSVRLGAVEGSVSSLQQQLTDLSAAFMAQQGRMSALEEQLRAKTAQLDTLQNATAQLADAQTSALGYMQVEFAADDLDIAALYNSTAGLAVELRTFQSAMLAQLAALEEAEKLFENSTEARMLALAPPGCNATGGHVGVTGGAWNCICNLGWAGKACDMPTYQKDCAGQPDGPVLLLSSSRTTLYNATCLSGYVLLAKLNGDSVAWVRCMHASAQRCLPACMRAPLSVSGLMQHFSPLVSFSFLQSYDSTLWTTTRTLNATSLAFDQTDAKLDAFNLFPLSTVRVGMFDVDGSALSRFIDLPLPAQYASMHELMVGNTFVPTHASILNHPAGGRCPSVHATWTQPR
jgi:hypothetical protein